MNHSDVLADRNVVALAKRIVDSYQRVVGERLVDVLDDTPDVQIARAVYELPAVVLSHDGAVDPTFTFANLAGQKLFDYSWDEFLKLRSHQSAEPEHRSNRAEMLERAASEGYISDYSGIRISGSGRRFEIQDAIIWNVFDAQGNKVGQAAVFDQWEFLGD